MQSSPTSRRPTGKLLTIDQVAERLGVTPRWVRRSIFEKRFRYVKVGALVRVLESDLDDFIQANRR